jgi:hypothetical protein
MRNVLGTLALSIFTLVSGPTYADVRTSKPGQWSGGGGVGFLANTPDGVEFALGGHADYFVTPPFSVGPLVQFAGGGNDLVLGVSAQAKYWWSVPGTRGLARVVVQGGIGFVWADIEDSDSGVAGSYGSFLVPLGVGFDYAVTQSLAVTVDFVLNLTSLGENARAGGREVDLHTNVMPGLYLGVRF